MVASYYIVHSEEYVDYNYHIYKKKATQYQELSKTFHEADDNYDKKDKLALIFEWISVKRLSNVIFIFYAFLGLLLIFDSRDIFVPLIFGLITFIAPIHMMLLASSTPEHPRVREIYICYIPIFVVCVGMVLFRYLLFFQK